MSDENATFVPVWTLSTTSGAQVPVAVGDGPLTQERLAELRSALAAFSDSPLVTAPTSSSRPCAHSSSAP